MFRTRIYTDRGVGDRDFGEVRGHPHNRLHADNVWSPHKKHRQATLSIRDWILSVLQVENNEMCSLAKSLSQATRVAD